MCRWTAAVTGAQWLRSIHHDNSRVAGYLKYPLTRLAFVVLQCLQHCESDHEPHCITRTSESCAVAFTISPAACPNMDKPAGTPE